ncbi:acetyl-CoA carboxylase biotin carboxylase subunit [Streptomyces calidiresistens]|uniref:acetyl/propionyl/methylcrotonyl-CoA carboxylase subunit alpha n=1 Tax=Streptomyces calidiresistens TaxID=1485586 RepID=UPI002B2072F9|nr:biotin carboxylase N-terminal domain-containing protein [Streptomyces calidiresistens]
MAPRQQVPRPAAAFDAVLVANRGEIAVRVIRTLRRLGLRSVAVHSDADADALHVREADTSVRIGPRAAAESYLRIDRLLEAAERTGAGAIHPGYGFLAENADFARAVADAGLVFVGPPASAVELMGDKIRAKETVAAAGVPVVPGSSGSGLSDAELIDAARAIGAAVLIKPAAGGGGKGMRLVRDPDRLPEEIAAARREARGAFGDDTLLVERWIDRPRHIEIQVLADDHGNVLHLGERECSLQRRHQKIVEEAPSPLLDEETRRAMGEAAVRAARSCGYRGAGTVEFIVPGDDPRSHWFMEMNTRLQVEHPVTELITGQDLVEWQLRIAAGESLEPLVADPGALAPRGHAVEARICAETPRPAADGEGVDFLPSAGTVRALREPTGPGVRVDSGIAAGDTVGTAYDPLLAKIIAHGPDRASALRRLRAALADTVVIGVDTNTGFLRRLLDVPEVREGRLDTGLVDREAPALVADLAPTAVPTEVYAAAALLRHAALEPEAGPTPPTGWVDPFSVPSGWRLGGVTAGTPHHLRVPGHDPVTVTVRGRAGDARLRVGDGPEVTARLTAGTGGGPVRVEVDGVVHRFHTAPDGSGLARDGEAWPVADHDPVAAAGAGGAAGAAALTAPMPGTVTVVKVGPGERVTTGQPLLIVEAMKMEHVIRAPAPGTVAAVRVAAGTAVAMDQELVVVDPEDEPDPSAAPAASGAGAPVPGGEPT